MKKINIEYAPQDGHYNPKELKVTTEDGYDLTKLGITDVNIDFRIDDLPRIDVGFLGPIFKVKGFANFNFDFGLVPTDILEDMQVEIRAELQERD